jgi:UDP-3-O-[3-hydroxymyristoyl] glucosamine N-acyltransferase
MISANGPEYDSRLNILINKVTSGISVSVVSDLKDIGLKLGIINGIENVSVGTEARVTEIKRGLAHKIYLGNYRRIVMLGECIDVFIGTSTHCTKKKVLRRIYGHIEITDNCVFGAQTGIAGSVRKAGMYQGSPAIDAMNWRRSSVGFKQLPDIMKRLQELEKK